MLRQATFGSAPPATLPHREVCDAGGAASLPPKGTNTLARLRSAIGNERRFANDGLVPALPGSEEEDASGYSFSCPIIRIPSSVRFGRTVSISGNPAAISSA